MRIIYSILLYMITPVVIIRLFLTGFSHKGYWNRWGERFGFVNVPAVSGPRLWIHAVSVGEVQAATPLVKRLSSDYPQYSFLVTTVTPTGSEQALQNLGSLASHAYLPYDLPGSINRFLDRTNPSVLIVMETELWPNLYHYCRKRGVCICLVNCRISENSFRGYKKLAGLTSQVLSNLEIIGAQSNGDAGRLISLGADRQRIVVTGNLKTDIYVPKRIYEQAVAIKQLFSHPRPVWIAASTHEGEEEIILRVQHKVLTRFPDCLLILAPRHPERSVALSKLSYRSGFNTAVRSMSGDMLTGSLGDATQVYLLDTIGELMTYYAVSDIAFVGGSLFPAYGGHNVLEPAALGVPVITGKYTGNFQEISRLLCDNNAQIRVSDEEQLSEKIILLMTDCNLRKDMGQAGRDFIERNRGSLDRTIDMMSGILS